MRVVCQLKQQTLAAATDQNGQYDGEGADSAGLVVGLRADPSRRSWDPFAFLTARGRGPSRRSGRPRKPRQAVSHKARSARRRQADIVHLTPA
jgi:hypothetical protein